MRDILTVFDEHYPELLGLSVVQEVPWWARLFVTLIWPFVGARTRRRVRFLGCGQTAKQPELRPEQLLTECGGELDVSFN
jgi:hypothetical protein